MKKFYSTTEVAKILGINRVTLFYKIKSGEVEAIKVGRNYIINTDELKKHMGNKNQLSENKRENIKKGVKRVVNEYKETLKLLKDS